MLFRCQFLRARITQLWLAFVNIFRGFIEFEWKNSMNKLQNTTNQNLESLVNKPYLYGFSTEIETETIPFGLTEKTINLISQKKNEPNFLLSFRLRAY